ncbi:MAG TPA: hypothetical protein VND68_02645, partial [Chloroflexia bacterium]|nr:hypothetical protein [Chloroflexia bacterium]
SLEHNLPAARSTSDLWPLLLFLAILLLPFDVGVRRLAITGADVARARAELQRRLGWGRRPAHATPQASTPQVAALFGAKERSRKRFDNGSPPAQLPDFPPSAPPTAASARDLQLEGRTGRSTSAAQSHTSPQAAPGPAQETPPTASEDDNMAARLRRSREQRH